MKVLLKGENGVEKWVKLEKVIAHFLNPQSDNVSLKSIDSNYISELQNKFPSVNVKLEFEAFKDFLSSKKRRYKNYKSAFRNWCRNQNKWSNGKNLDTKTSDWKYDTTGKSVIGYCVVCDQSDFYNPKSVTFEDSRCCQGKIKAKR